MSADHSAAAAALAPPSWLGPLHESLQHHQGIDVAQLPVAKGPGQCADDLKAVALPAAAADSLAAAVLGHHIARIGDMGAEGEGVGPRPVGGFIGADLQGRSGGGQSSSGVTT